MKARFSSRFKLPLLALAMSFILSGASALAQTICIGNCLAQLNACRNGYYASVSCEDAYDSCVEGCLSRSMLLP